MKRHPKDDIRAKQNVVEDENDRRKDKLSLKDMYKILSHTVVYVRDKVGCFFFLCGIHRRLIWM